MMAWEPEGIRIMKYNRLMKKTDRYPPVYHRRALCFHGKPATAANCLGFPLVFLSILLMLAGCATTLPKDVQRTPSTAFANYNTTSIGQFFEEAALQHPGKSGFTLIRKGRRAFTSRIAMTAYAEKTMDLQYYIWENRDQKLLYRKFYMCIANANRNQFLPDLGCVIHSRNPSFSYFSHCVS
jgi:hypothetical protein